MLAKTLKMRGGIPTLDMTRNVFVSTLGSNPTDVANSVNGVMAAHLHWARRFQVIVQLGRLDGVRNNGGSSNLPWLTNYNIYKYEYN